MKEEEQTGLLAHGDTLLLEGLPSNYNHLMTQELMKGFSGVTNIRMVPEKQSAVINFDTNEQAKVALSALHGFKLSEEESARLRASFIRSD